MQKASRKSALGLVFLKNLDRKKLSHRRSNFPSRCRSAHSRAQEGLSEFHSKEMVTLGVGYPDNFSFQIARTLGHGSRSRKRGAGDFERNLRCWPNRAVHRNEGTAGGDIDRGGEF